MARDCAGAEAGRPGGRVGLGPVQAAASRGEGDDGGPGGMRGRGGAGERDRADGKGGWAGGYPVKRQEGLPGGDDGLAGPTVCEDPGALARRDKGQRLRDEPRVERAQAAVESKVRMRQATADSVSPVAPPKRLAFFERYLTLWVFLCMMAGVAFGKALPDVTAALSKLEFGRGSQVNVP